MGPILPNDMIYRPVHIIFSRYCDNPILHTQVEKLPPRNVGQPKKLINSFPTSHPLPPLIYSSYPLLPFPSLPLLYATHTHTQKAIILANTHRNSSIPFLPTPFLPKTMASSSVTAGLTITSAGHKRPLGSITFFNPMKLSPKATTMRAPLKSKGRTEIRAASSMKEKAVTGLTAVALTAAMVIPDIAEAAQPGLSPSLKNFLLSIVSGGVVLTVLVGAVIGVANFDPVKRS